LIGFEFAFFVEVRLLPRRVVEDEDAVFVVDFFFTMISFQEDIVGLYGTVTVRIFQALQFDLGVR